MTGNGGLNVIDINGDINNSLILKGTANDIFIVNVKGSVDLQGKETLGLAGGVTADHVLYNFIGPDGSVITGKNNVIDGTLLGPTYGFFLRGDVDGAIIGARGSELLLDGADGEGSLIHGGFLAGNTPCDAPGRASSFG